MKHRNWYGFDHKVVKEKFEGNPEYIGDMRLHSGTVWAVYKSENPNREKGHKDFMLLCKTHVYGLDLADMKKQAKMSAVKCLNCGTVLVSLTRHDYHTCDCENKTMIDGGGDYLRCGGASLALVQQGTYNLLTNKFRATGKKKNGKTKSA